MRKTALSHELIDLDSHTGQARGKKRKGSIAVLAVVMMAIVLGMVAFAVDLGYLSMARTETQRTADATAHAAAIEFARSGDITEAVESVYEVSGDFTAANPVLGEVAAVTRNVDVTVGRYEFGSGQTDLSFHDYNTYNAVKVRIRRTDDQNGAVKLFFGGVLKHQKQELESEAIAALIRNVSGFKIPPSGENVPIIPITLKERYWDRATGGEGYDDDDDDDNGGGEDEWAYDPVTQSVSSGSDGIPEVVLFPNRTGSSGNLGTVNIGVSNNSTSFLGNQIRNGLNQAALNFHGGSLQLGSGGQLQLSGNPGLSASLQNDLQSIVGQVRAIPLYRSVTGGGNNAKFKIVRWVAVRIMSARLSGGDKAIHIQPASMTFDGLIQGNTGGQSSGIYSPPRIVY